MFNMEKKKPEPTLEEMPLLEYTLKRYAKRLARRLGLAEDIVEEKWDVWVDGSLTYWENKARIQQELLKLAKPERKFEAKEYVSELERYEEEEIHKQLEYLLYTLRDILEGNTSSDYYIMAEEMNLLEEPISRWIQELEDWKNTVIRKTFIRKYQSLLNELVQIQLRLKAYKAKHGDVPIKELVGKWDKLFEDLATSKVTIEEEEVELIKPIVVEKPTTLKKLEIEEEEEKEIKKTLEEMTESEAIEYFKQLEAEIKKATKLPLKQSYERLKKLAPEIKKIVESPAYQTMFEAQAVAYYFKQAFYPLVVYYKERDKYKWLLNVKSPVKVVVA